MANPLTRFLPRRFRKDELVIPVVRISGAIMASGGPLRQTVSMAAVAPLLEKAFANKASPAVAIQVNSPGGSPVQSRLIHQRIRDLAAEKNKDVIVFCEDVAASGGYMIACAGDTIVADPSSIVGSIGVVSGGFGFVDLLQKIGVERRVHTAGANKAILDPFRPERPEDIEHLKSLQLEIHETFVNLVKARRSGKLSDDPDLFTGLFWTGARGKELGLVDQVGDLRTVLRERYGRRAKPVMMQAKRSLLGARQGTFGIGGGTDLLGAGAVEAALSIAEERALFARYGL